MTPDLTSGRLLAKNTLWNLLGQGAPLLVAIFAIPILIRGLGTDRFGILTVAWVVVGYFSLFDLGLGRALTQLVAGKLGGRQEGAIPPLVWTALAAMTALGIAGAMVVGLLSPWLTHAVLKIPADLQEETLGAFYLLAASIPVVIATAGLRGVLEAYQRFGLSSAVRVPMGVFTFAGPVAVLPFSQSLSWIVGVLLAGRIAALLAYAVLCLSVTPGLLHRVVLERAGLAPLLRFGGWMTVTNLVGPLMTYLDRFLILAVISASAATYYAAPYDVVTKLVVLPVALAGVLFPAFAASFNRDPERAAMLFARAAKYLFVILFPVVLVIVALAREGLTLWLGGPFASRSTHVLQWLAAGIFFNSLAQVPFALVQGAGKADWTARLHLAELPLYLLTLWILLALLGIDGAAMAWMLRAGIDMLILFAMAQRLLPPAGVQLRAAALFGAAIAAFAIAAALTGPAVKAAVLVLALAGFVLFAWFQLLSPEERALGRDGLRTARVVN